MPDSIAIFSKFTVRLVQSHRTIINFGIRFVDYLQKNFGFFNRAASICHRLSNPVSIYAKRFFILRIRQFKQFPIK